MNTPAHLIIGAAAFGRPGDWRVTTAAIVGALVPDFSLYFMVFWNGFVRGMEAEEIFGEAYYSGYWQQVFAIDNSVIIWGALLGVAVWRRWPVLLAFAGAGTVHILLDLPLHHDDGRMHFWPLTDWVFASPISYWDPAHFGGIVGPLELGLCLILLVWLWGRYAGLPAKGLMVLALILEVVPTLVFPMIFGGPEG